MAAFIIINARHGVRTRIGIFVIRYGMFQMLPGLQLYEGFVIDALFG